MFQSPEKMEDDPLPRSPQPLTQGKSKMSHRTSPLETGDSVSLLFQEGREISWHVTWPGGPLSWPGSAAHPLPVTSHISLVFLLFTSCQDWIAWLCPNAMPLWRRRRKKKSDHEIGLEFSVYTWCPVALCFQMKMLCMAEESQWSVNLGSREWVEETGRRVCSQIAAG